MKLAEEDDLSKVLPKKFGIILVAHEDLIFEPIK